MKNLLLFGGTTEGRLLTQWLSDLPVHVTVCVATDYGRSLLPEPWERLDVRAGRLDLGGMERLMQQLDLPLVVDATHPYAVEVTRNIRAAAEALGCPRYRLVRTSGAMSEEEDFLTADSVAQAVSLLSAEEGAVLAATGSKELEEYTRLPGFAQRVYPRVLPTAEAITSCIQMGFARDHIIAMQGPFSAQLNCALMQQFQIRTLVTKDGGAAGGFSEKLEGARQAGARVIVVRRPGEEQGLSLEELESVLKRWMEED